MTKLHILDYIKVLSFEYISFSIREEIFEEGVYIKMVRDIADKKKNKINSIAESLKIKTMFNDTEQANKIFSEYTESFPNNMGNYGDKMNEKKFWDNYYLYRDGRVVYFGGKEFTILNNDPQSSSLCLVSVDAPNSVITNVSYDDIVFKELLEKIKSKIIL